MATFFLVLIYLTFISLGLPDSLLGAAWPIMRFEFNAPLEAAGLLSMVITGGTIVSSLLCEKMIRRFGTGRVTAFSVLATAVALLGFSLAPAFGWLFVFAIPLGIGGGAVDAALNNYVALHYAARHMSWLHSFWGVGAFTGPIILSLFMQGRGGGALLDGWRGGYFSIFIIQIVLTAILLFTLPLWKSQNGGKDGGRAPQKTARGGKTPGVLCIPGVKSALFTFLFYCACESTVGLWCSSYLVEYRGMAEASAARGSALYFGGIMLGRFLNGFLTAKFSSKQLIRTGVLVIVCGALLLALPLPVPVSLAALTLIGIGCAPIYPSMIHETPHRYGAENSQKIIGMQMASAYTGSTLVPPVVGFLSARTGLWIVPLLMLGYGVFMLVLTEHINRVLGKPRTKTS